MRFSSLEQFKNFLIRDKISQIAEATLKDPWGIGYYINNNIPYNPYFWINPDSQEEFKKLYESDAASIWQSDNVHTYLDLGIVLTPEKLKYLQFTMPHDSLGAIKGESFENLCWRYVIKQIGGFDYGEVSAARVLSPRYNQALYDAFFPGWQRITFPDGTTTLDGISEPDYLVVTGHSVDARVEITTQRKLGYFADKVISHYIQSEQLAEYYDRSELVLVTPGEESLGYQEVDKLFADLRGDGVRLNHLQSLTGRDKSNRNPNIRLSVDRQVNKAISRDSIEGYAQQMFSLYRTPEYLDFSQRHSEQRLLLGE